MIIEASYMVLNSLKTKGIEHVTYLKEELLVDIIVILSALAHPQSDALQPVLRCTSLLTAVVASTN